MDYAHVTAGVIDILPTRRPVVWKDDSGSYTGLNNADDAFLLNIGWYPVVQLDPPFDPATEVYEDQDVSQMVIGATEITWTRAVRALTQQELDDIANQQAIAARKNIPRQGDGLPEVRAELDALKQTLLDQGILTGI